MKQAPKLFMVWAVCRPDGTPVAYVEYSRGKNAADKLAAEMNSKRGKNAIGAFYVQPKKVCVEAA